MLSYRHAYHAGNHADVLKHIIWCDILLYLQKKDKPFYVHDTHGGAGIYQIQSEMMQKKKEYLSGIELLLRNDVIQHGVLKDYVTMIKKLNDGESNISLYPGSPLISQLLLRDKDRMNITEMHSTDFEKLKSNLKTDKRIKVHKSDAYDGLISMLPPKERRGAVLIDPSYEVKSEYQLLPKKLKIARKKFSNGVYAIWYPVLKRSQTEAFIHDLIKGEENVLRAELNVLPDREDGFGMVGSGMIVFNPHYTLKDTLEEILPVLQSVLAPQTGAFKMEVC